MCRNSRSPWRLLLLALFFAAAMSSATAQATPQAPPPSLPNELAAIPSSELLTALRARVLEISARLSSISEQLTTLEAAYADQSKELLTSYAYSTSLSAERDQLQREKGILESRIADLEKSLAKAERQRDAWKTAALIASGATAGALIAGPVGAAVGAAVGAVVGIAF